jgi:uncharacterized protein (TIGR02118 family)
LRPVYRSCKLGETTDGDGATTADVRFAGCSVEQILKHWEVILIRVNVLYPSSQGARFDFDYYTQRHLPMVKQRLEPLGLLGITVDKGVAGLAPGSPAAYVTVASLQFESLESLQQGLAAHGAEILGDIPNYTDVQPVMQVSEILM